jgi:hypothetical protein
LRRGIAAAGVLALILLVGIARTGCGRKAPTANRRPEGERATAAAPLPLNPDRARLAGMVVEAQRKRVMGRRTSLRDVARVVGEDGPIVAAAAWQPQAQGALRQIARDMGLSLKEARREWIALQEADLLLESGGNPEDVSPANAVGVAQWIAETGRRAGLKIDLAASKKLTAQIDERKRQAAWREYLLRPDADPRAPGAPPISRQQAEAQLPLLRAQLESLRAQRRRYDPRYDPKAAIFAHARYLLGLYPRFPSLDWVFQAFHGGEAGVRRTLKRYLGKRWPGSAAAAIRRGRNGRPLCFEDLYFGTTPRAQPAAFAYLYGRLDDHRYYWWKLRAARGAIALYRRDPAAFRKQWEAFLPGRAKEAYWYPNAGDEALADTRALQDAQTNGRLVSVKSTSDFAIRPASPDPASARLCAALRPESKGALLLVAAAYRNAGGRERLTVGDMTRTQADLERMRALPPPSRRSRADKRRARPRQSPSGPLWPPDLDAKNLPGGGPPADLDFHTTGLAFDLLRSADRTQWKTLEYALGWLCDRHILWWREETEGGSRRYHVVPNPQYAATLARIGIGEKAPVLPGL